MSNTIPGTDGGRLIDMRLWKKGPIPDAASTLRCQAFAAVFGKRGLEAS